MEVEFLSNMRYSLFASKEAWEEWHIKLGKFGTYFDRASRPVLDSTPRPVGPSGAPSYMPFTLPSPPASNQASPPFGSTYSPSYRTNSNSNTPILLPQITSATVSPIGQLPELDARMNGRKRSWDDQGQEPPPKRNARSFSQLPQISNITAAHTSYAPTLPRLPLPNVSVPSTHDGYMPASLPPHLPPPGGRAMSTVYPPPVQWPQPPSTSTPAASLQMAPHAHASSSVGNRSRQPSPFPGSANSSPTSAAFPSAASHTQNQSRLSPSHFLSQRASPYRPVRSVTTLRMPPPSDSLHDPARHVELGQMQYQSLGRPATERRVGHLPYMHHEAWPQANQFNQWHGAPQPTH